MVIENFWMQFHICANTYGHLEIHIQCLFPFYQNIGGQPKFRTCAFKYQVDIRWASLHNVVHRPPAHLRSWLERQVLGLNSGLSESEFLVVGPQSLHFNKLFLFIIPKALNQCKRHWKILQRLCFVHLFFPLMIRFVIQQEEKTSPGCFLASF